ncbi:hypothetical protein APR08_001463 [Nocardia amikacinitolerans]|nr:hypothetical protein [Nocardia amikacinitolerans]
MLAGDGCGTTAVFAGDGSGRPADGTGNAPGATGVFAGDGSGTAAAGMTEESGDSTGDDTTGSSA